MRIVLWGLFALFWVLLFMIDTEEVFLQFSYIYDKPSVLFKNVIHRLDDSNFDEITDGGYILLYVFTTWCTQCQQFKPTWKQFVVDMQTEQIIEQRTTVRFAQVDAELNPMVGIDLEVSKFPSLFLLKHGRIVSKFEHDRTLPKLTHWLKSQTSQKTSTTTSKIQGSVPGKPGSIQSNSNADDREVQRLSEGRQRAQEITSTSSSSSSKVTGKRGGKVGVYKSNNNNNPIFYNDIAEILYHLGILDIAEILWKQHSLVLVAGLFASGVFFGIGLGFMIVVHS